MISERRQISGPSSRTAGGRCLWLLVLLICAGFYIFNLNSLQIGQHVDDAVYISLARSLNAGLGYVRFEDPAHPFEPQYPPAMAYLVAGVLAVSGGSLQALRLIPLLFSLASLLLAYAFFHRRAHAAVSAAPHAWTVMLLALFGLNHLVVGYAGMIMTEAPFVCLTLAAIVWLDRLDARERGHAGAVSSGAHRPGVTVGWILGMAAILAASCLMRTVAYAYVIAAALWLWRTHRRPAAVAVVVLTAVALMPWLITQKQATGAWFGGGYLADILGPGDTHWHPLLRPVENLVVYSSELLPAAVLPFFGEQVGDLAARLSVPWLPMLMGLLISGLIVVGGWWHRPARPDPAAYICLALLAVLLAWSYRYTRFCLPLVPLCLVYLLAAADRSSALGKLPATRAQRRACVWALGAIVLAGFVARDANMLYHPPRHSYTDLQAVARFVEAHTPADSIIITHAPYAVAVYADRSFVDLLPPKRPGGPPAADPAEFLPRLAPYHPRYVLIYSTQVGWPPRLPAFLDRPAFRPQARDDQVGAALFQVGEIPTSP